MTTPLTNRCPVCGAELPVNAPQGLCPRCLLLGVAAPTEPGAQAGPHSAPPPIDSVRAAFPQLEIIELIGQGGMGAVFKARQPKLDRFVALKILPEGLSRDPAFADRFTREAKLLARLHHPNIVTIHDFGQANGYFFLLMEYVEGVNLRQAMAAGRFTPEQALAIVPMICESLQYAHDEGVLHRDIKPENILLDTKGRVRLVDFGIAKLASAGEQAEPPGAAPPAQAALTQTGTALGTPSYMAPEQQLSPSTVDQRADIYSLGVVFYELLTGELPAGRFARPSQRTPLDPRIDDVVVRAMARQRENRFPTAAAVKTAVDAITAGAPVGIPEAAQAHPYPAHPWARQAMLLLLTVTGLLTLYDLSRSQLLRHLWWQLSSGWAEAPHRAYPANWPSWWPLSAGHMESALIVGGLVAAGWICLSVWRRRIWLTAAFQPWDLWHTPQAVPPGFVPSWTVDDWLRLVGLGWIGLLGVECAWLMVSGVMLLAQAVTSPMPSLQMGILYVASMLLSPPYLLALLLLVYVRRELRRTDVSEPAAPPSWWTRATLLFLVFAAVTSVRLPTGDGPVFSIGAGYFAVVGALAMLTRSRIWRALALAFLTERVVVALSGTIFFGSAALQGQLDAVWWNRVWFTNGFTLALAAQALDAACYAAGLAALLSTGANRTFGIPARRQMSATA